MKELTVTGNAEIATIGQAANDAASRHVFADYRSRRAKNTVKRQDADLALFGQFLAGVGVRVGLTLFAEFLASVGVKAGNLARDPQAWHGISWGLCESFVKWQLQQGYAVGTVNLRLSTIKTYARLALKAGALDATAYALIRAVEGYSRKEGKRIDEQREAADVPTRKGHKKSEPVSLSKEQAAEMKQQPDTPQGRRDRLLVCLLLDLGLRVGEVVILTVDCVNLKERALTFYRPKVDKLQTHQLINGSFEAVRTYMEHDALAVGPLLRSSAKDGRLHDAGMSRQAISRRVKVLGERVGVEGLSAHDLRHFWATQAARNGTAIDRLQDAGGWASPAMPLRYIGAARIANEGVRLE